MPLEIERKFLVINDDWRSLASGKDYRQGYLSLDPARTVRVRAVGEQAWLTIKGKTQGAVRSEYEYEIPVDHARELLDTLCLRPLIEKRRFRLNLHDVTWEIDEFSGDNVGLIIAEVELNSADQQIGLPGWVGREVTGDPRYYNASLVMNPYSCWDEE